MPYCQKTVIAGEVKFKYKYFTPRYPGKHLPRNCNTNHTNAAQWKINEKNSILKLTWLILNNFKRNDLRFELTYAKHPPSPKQAYRDLTNFIARLKRRYAKVGAPLKWVATTEYDGHRIHHHLLVNNVGLGRDVLDEIWPFGKMMYRSFRFYDGAPDDAARVANYFVKETRDTYCRADAVQKQRYRASRNLVPPKIKVEVIQSRHWRDVPKAPKGYYVADLRNGYTDNGYLAQSYKLIPDEEEDNESHTKTK